MRVSKENGELLCVRGEGGAISMFCLRICIRQRSGDREQAAGSEFLRACVFFPRDALRPITRVRAPVQFAGPGRVFRSLHAVAVACATSSAIIARQSAIIVRRRRTRDDDEQQLSVARDRIAVSCTCARTHIGVCVLAICQLERARVNADGGVFVVRVMLFFSSSFMQDFC